MNCSFVFFRSLHPRPNFAKACNVRSHGTVQVRQVRSGFTPVTSGPSKETSAPKITDHWAPELQTYT